MPSGIYNRRDNRKTCAHCQLKFKPIGYASHLRGLKRAGIMVDTVTGAVTRPETPNAPNGNGHVSTTIIDGDLLEGQPIVEQLAEALDAVKEAREEVKAATETLEEKLKIAEKYLEHVRATLTGA